MARVQRQFVSKGGYKARRNNLSIPDIKDIRRVQEGYVIQLRNGDSRGVTIDQGRDLAHAWNNWQGR